MTELPKSLKELTEQTDKVLGSSQASTDSSGKLIEDALPKANGTTQDLTRTSAETTQPPKPEAKKDEGGALDFAGGAVKGFGTGLVNLVVDTKKLLFNYDDSAIRKAALSGSGVTNSGIGFLPSITKSGSELGMAASTILTNPGGTIGGLGKQIAADWDKGDAGKKGEMFGEGFAFAATLGIGTGSMAKGFKNLSRFGKAEELVAGARVLSNAGKMETVVAGIGKTGTVARELSAGERLAATTGKLGEATRLETTVTGLGKAGELAAGERALGTGARLETTVQGLGTGAKAADLTAGAKAADLTAGAKAADLTAGAKAADLTAGAKAADLTAGAKVTDLTGGARLTDISGTAKVGEASAYSRITQAEKVAVEVETAGRALTQPSKLGREMAAADSGLAATREAQVLAKEAKAVDDAVTAVRAADSVAAQQAAIRDLRVAVGEYNTAVDATKLGAELKIQQKALVEFEAAAARSTEFASARGLQAPVYRQAELAGTRLETAGQGLTSKLDDAKAVSTASKSGGATAVEQKAVEVEQAMRNVKTAETAVAREQAITNLRSKVGEYNAAVDTGATAAKASELRITNKSLVEFETAGRQAGEARSLAFRSSTIANAETQAQGISQTVQRGRQSAESTEASATAARHAREVDEGLLRARAAESVAARERALADLRTSTQNYNRAIEATPATAAKAAELRVADRSLLEFEAAAREAHHARVLAKHEALVGMRVAEADARAAALSQNLSASRQAVTTGSRTETALSIEQKAAKVEQSVQMARSAQSGIDNAWALKELRTNVTAYNQAVAGSGLPAASIKDLQVSERALAGFETASKEASLARMTAQREVALSGDFIRGMAGRSDLVFAGGTGGSSLAARADGLASSQLGSVRAAMDRLAGAAAGAWRESGYIARGLSRADAATLAYAGIGTYVVARDLYLLGDRTIDRIIRLNAEQQAQATRDAQTERERAQAASQTGSGQASAPGAERVERAGVSGRNAAAASQSDVTSAAPAQRATSAPGPSARQGADAQGVGTTGRPAADATSDDREAAAKQAGGPFERTGFTRPAAPAGSDDLRLSPVLHAMRAPAYQATPALASTAEMFVQRQRQELSERRYRRGDNQFGQEWFGNHVYLAAPPPVVEAEGRPVPVAHQPRRFGGVEPEIPRNVNPSFKPQIIYATQAELFGQTARPGDAKAMAAVGADGARRVRTTLLNDEQKLVKQYPFLVSAAGETGISAGSKTVFKLAGVEKSEPKTERPGGGTSTTTAPAGTQGGGDPQPVPAIQSPTGQTDPNANQDEQV